MEVPELVRSALEGERVEASVDLGGDDRLFVAPSRTVVYRSEGLLSDETVEEYPHDAEAIRIEKGRRKAKVVLDYGLDGEQTLGIPAKRLDEVFHNVFSGVLRERAVVDPDEDVIETFQFSELTLTITQSRVVKHVGAVAWDEDYEQFHYEDVTDLTVESGSVATSIVLTLDDRQERFKAPNESERAVRETLESALLSYHDVESVEELRVRAEEKRDAEEDSGEETKSGETIDESDDLDERMSFGDGPDPLDTDTDTEVDAEAETDAEVDVDANTDTATDGEASAPTSEASDPERVSRRHDTGSKPERESVEPHGTGDGQFQTVDSEDVFEGSGFQSAGPVDSEDISVELEALREDVSTELDALREVIEKQNEQLTRQRETIDQLIEELRRGR